MKYVISLLTIFLFASHLFAQQPTISYLMADEAKSQLQIHGSFGIDSGSVSIEDTTLGIVSWSDSLIICNLPDSGKGAGGHVEVQTIHGVSNKRMLSIFSAMVDYLYWGWMHQPAPQASFWFLGVGQRWNLNWRVDIGSRAKIMPHLISFEISKSSFGKYISGEMPWAGFIPPDGRFPWSDSSSSSDSTISLKGQIDLNNFRIKFDTLKFTYAELDYIFRYPYIPSSISFDTSGYISGYYNSPDPRPYWAYRGDSLYNQKILFPPSPKSRVSQFTPSNTDKINIIINRNQIALHSASALGPTTASLYTIDGRLLKRTKFDISAPGNYSIDVSDVHTPFAILVLQTSRGVITKKIIF